MLDEIIDYVKFLQLQVKVPLSSFKLTYYFMCLIKGKKRDSLVVDLILFARLESGYDN